MIRDVFYFGDKPNIHPREKFATSITDARNQATTEHFWIVNEFCDYTNFDWDWDFEFLPDSDVWAEAHNNVWPSLHQKDSGTWLCNLEHSEIIIYRADVDPLRRKNEINKHWKIVDNIDPTKFDFSWHPDPTDPPYIYKWGCKYFPVEVQAVIEYHVAKAEEPKFFHELVEVLPEWDRWSKIDSIDKNAFDFSWRPNPTSPPYVYQFGTLYDRNDGPCYTVPDNTGEIVYLERTNIASVQSFAKYQIKTTLEDLVNEHPNEVFWALNPDLLYNEFDFNWRPSMDQVQYVHAFGTKDNVNTQTYFVNAPQYLTGHREINYVENKILNVKTNIDMFYIDRSNPESSVRFEKLKERFPKLQKTRYLGSWADTINRCVKRSTSNLCWILNSELDYTEFKFDFYPNPWQMQMVHIFGTQWSSWGTTFLVNKESFAEDTKFVKIVEHLTDLNFVKQRTAVATNCLYDVFLIDHGNTNSVADILKTKISERTLCTVPYKECYLETFKEILANLPEKKEHYIWVCSTVCDYTNFDFSYICDPFAKEQLHVFPSNEQKFGDTFLINVNKLRELMGGMNMLEEYKRINYNKHQKVHRLPSPTFVTPDDTHVASIMQEFDFPYAIFITSDNDGIEVKPNTTMSLWSPESKQIVVTSTGGTRIIVPKEAKSYISSQLYDYPHVFMVDKPIKSKPLDVVFLSNGEPIADENYRHLCKVVKGLGNRIVRVSNVNGRAQAYHAAANESNTSWFFAVFAKIEVSANFDWSWQPDRLQMPKHYIFNAFNPVNGLEYGHQAIIAYNKKLTLANEGVGLDFTLDSPHTVVETLSGVARFNTDPFSTWRTAFREAIKLRRDPADISKERLEIWMTKADGDFAEFSIKGAKDAVAYYESVNGEVDQLRLSYEWSWLLNKFNSECKSN